MAVIETWFEQDLQKPVKVRYIDGNLFSHNGNGNRIGVIVTNNGDPVTLTGTVSGYAVLADGTTVPCTGSISGNKASILVPAAAYSPGSILISIFLTDGTTVTTLAALSSSVIMARTGNQIDPGSVVTDWTNTINAAMQSVETAAANLGNIIATPYENLPFPVPLGKYTIYNNGLYRCISPIASSEAWTAAHWTNVKLGDDVADLKSAIDNTNELLGLPVTVELVYDSYSVPKRGGEFYNSTAEIWKATDYIPTTGIKKIYFQGISQGSGNVVVPLAFYDSEKVYISAAPATSSGMHIETGSMDVPANAAYFKQSRYINPNDHEIPNSNNYTKYVYTSAAYPVGQMYDDLYKYAVFGYLFSGHLEVDTQNRLLTVKINNDVILTTNQKSIHTGLTNNETFTLPDANNYAILYEESTGNIVIKTGSANGFQLKGYVVLGYYALGYIYGALGLILVNGEVKNKTLESANISSEQITTNKNNILSLTQTTTALSTNLSNESAARQNADNALGARIDNLVAPSGESVAEITDARVGVYGTIYSTLEARLNAEFGLLFGKTGNILTVGVGKEYQTVGAAVNASNAGDIIFIFDGVYTERIVNRDKPINIIGQSVEGVIIQYQNDDYSKPPLEMAKGVLRNITLHATQVANTEPHAYALHCDFQGSGVIGGYLYCENVKFINDNYRAVGLGLRGNAHIDFVNCLFVSSSESEALYMHDANDTAYDISNQSVSFRNCTFHNNSNSKHTIEVVTQERQIGVATVEWQRNIVVNDSTGGTLAMTHYQGRDLGADNWMGSSDWVLDTTSALNTESIMNN